MFRSFVAPFVLALTVAGATDTARADDTPSASDIVAAADRVRNPTNPFRLTLVLAEYQSGAAHDSVTLAVHSKIDSATHQYRNLVRYAAPQRDAGKLVLLSGGSMWFYDPASKASIRISAQQRLIGQASNGDVLTVNLAHDYASRLLGDESIQDADHQPRDTWHLELSAATNEAAYARLETWIEKGTMRPVKSKFYSDSGRPLKLAFYRRYESALGAARPLETIIVDAVDPHLVTKVTASDYRAENVQDAWFQRDYLPRFSEE
jgi:hypothetical protein